ncbi:MAG: hypothetical protein ACRELA_14990, partial [Candidatus Rokuibacteriota bacterium]
MQTPFPWLAIIAAAACTTATQRLPSQAVLSPAGQAQADSGRASYTAADVHFLSGMIGHHA